MKKMIAIVLSVLVLAACLVVARWAEGNNRVNPTGTIPNTKAPDTITTSPTTVPSEPESTPGPTNPDDIENGLGWG